MTREVNIPHPEGFRKNPIGTMRVPDNLSEERINQEIERVQTQWAQKQADPIAQAGHESFTGGAVSMGHDITQVGAMLATGAASEVYAGWSGIAATVPGGETPAEAVERVRTNYIYEPKDETAKELANTIAHPFIMYEKAADYSATALSGGNPYAATAIKTVLMGAPDILGARGLTGAGKRAATRRNINTQTQDLMDAADRLNIDLTELNVRRQVADSIRETAPSSAGAVEDVQNTLRIMEEAEGQKVTRLFDEARATPAWVKSGQLEDFRPSLTEKLSDYGKVTRDGVDFSNMPKLKDRLDELDELLVDSRGRRAPRQNIDIDKLEGIRRRSWRNKAPKADKEQNKALSIFRKQMDEFLNQQFVDDMVSGDPQAIAKWRNARKANEAWRRRYHDDKVVARLIDSDTSIKGAKEYIFGANAVGMNKQTLSTVRRLKEVLGEDSPRMEALRQEVLFDVAQPLIIGAENATSGAMSQFIKNYDRLIKKNHDVVEELGLNVERDLKPLREFAESVERVEPGTVRIPEMTTVLSRFTFGHAIAKQGLKVNLAKSVMDMVLRQGETGQKAIIYDIINRNMDSGVSADTLLIDPKSVAAGSVISSAAEYDMERYTKDEEE